MEDKQIIELYWNREEAATYEVARKYGSYCEMIANHINAVIRLTVIILCRHYTSCKCIVV